MLTSLSDNHRHRISSVGKKPHTALFFVKLFTWFFLLISGSVLATFDIWVLRVAGVFLIGAMFAHGVELQHQALHYTGFRSRRANEVLGIILGIPMLVSFTQYRVSHLRHHRKLGTPEDKEYFDYGDQPGSLKKISLVEFLIRILMHKHYLKLGRTLVASTYSTPALENSKEINRQIRRDHLLIGLCITALSLFSLYSNEYYVIQFWAVPLFMFANPIHAVIEMPEHYRCDVDNIDILANTRTITSNRFMTWFTNGNNFHVEHHLCPGTPMQHLGKLHEIICVDAIHYCRGYRSFFRSNVSGLK